MNIAVVHYHLNRGGVTRVIANQLLALDRTLQQEIPVRVAILFGGRSAGWPHQLGDRLNRIQLELSPLPRLDYESGGESHSRELAADMRAALNRLGFEAEHTLLHVHNHGLGKNLSLPGALRSLAEAGYRLLLQIHDFAEDFRSENYRRLSDGLGPDGIARFVYPQAPHIHYAVLNRRDCSILTSAGVRPERVHFLPNPVSPPEQLPSRADARRKLHERFSIRDDARFALYPVRGIRRKNVGEAMALAVAAGDDTQVGLTLATLNPAQRPGYETWKRFAAERSLPFHFELGEAGGLTFGENLAAADVILTTSVAEGFGMVFLESWLAGRPLAGRNLPEITSDFSAAGLRLDSMYDTLRLPVEWIGRDTFCRAFADVYPAVLASYGRRALNTADAVESWMDVKIQDGWIDFADLDEALQQRVIQKLHDEPRARDDLRDLNPKASNLCASNASDDSLIKHNKQIIRRDYALDPSGARLAGVYRDVFASSVGTPDAENVNADRILDGFLDVARFRLLRGA